MGITRVDTVLMLLSVSTKMVEHEKETITRLMIQGFDDLVREAGAKTSGGQTVFNPWVIIGGVAMSVIPRAEVIYPNNAEAGDVLVLTKPLGTQIAVNLNQWNRSRSTQWTHASEFISEAAADVAYDIACASMSRLNLNGARLMQKYKARAATDITGFGFLGHTRNLAAAQHAKVDMRLHTLPVISGMADFDKKLIDFRLKEGFSAETSGGLLIALRKDVASSFMNELRERYGQPSWLVGEVIKGEGKASIAEDAQILEVQQF
eukprot:TRINITY_DN172_c0_g2_i1.p1 TRINITY_DN172_c0_g2~~TRINITY_DN172_c0_g2_i1.p1  ORF type:complete len:263 (+),score=50.12 TRINITY_DN172_c0_g2_i1:438-1226(+)